MRRVLFWAVVAGALLFVAANLGQIGAFAAAVSRASFRWLLAAVALQVVYFVLYAASYREAFSVVDLRRPLRQLIPAVLAALFVNVVTPSAGTAGPALMIDDAVQHGCNGPRSATAILLAQGAVFAAHVLAIAPGMIVLALAGLLRVYQSVAVAVLVAIVLMHVVAFVLALRRPATLLAVLLALQEAAERAAHALHRTLHVPIDWAERAAEDMRRGAESVSRRPGGVLRTVLLAVLGYAFDMLSLGAIALAFGRTLGAGEIMATYAVGKLFWIVSPVPQGIGFVEGAMTAALVSFGEADPLAAVIALTFRGLSFWLPFAIGFALLRATGSFTPRRPPRRASAS